ncbi:MAG: hypothetical protein U0V75_16225 [Ferruginibacter sp.]
MKKYFAFVLLTAFTLTIQGQQKLVMGFPVTDYIIDAGDSITIVQVMLPEGLQVKEKTTCIIKSIYRNEGDSVIGVASGRCQLIKGRYFYFGLRAKEIKRKPVAGDMLYTDVIANPFYQGALFNVIRHGITLKSVYDTMMVDLQTLISMKTPEAEKKYLSLLCADIKFTGAEMIRQGGVENVAVTGGRFKGQKILDAMQTITEKDLKDFFRYIHARPDKYAGQTWKISEITATWMAAGTPVPVE